MKKILLCTDGSAFAQSSYSYAGWLAPRLKAEVDVLYVSDLRSQKAAQSKNFSGSIGINAAKDLLDKLVKLEHDKAKLEHDKAQYILKEAENSLNAAGVRDLKLIHKTGFLVDSLQEFEAEVDLIILGKRGETAEFASRHLGSHTERIVRSSHKPCLVTSRNYQPIERLLLAYDGSKSCQKVLQFLIESPAFRGLELHLLTVTKKSEDQTAVQRLDSAQKQLEAAGFNPITQIQQGVTEEVISNYIEREKISLLIMGAYGHSRIRQLIIGSTTVQMLRKSQIPVLLFR